MRSLLPAPSRVGLERNPDQSALRLKVGDSCSTSASRGISSIQGFFAWVSVPISNLMCPARSSKPWVDSPLSGVEFAVAVGGSGSIPAGRSHGHAAREQSHGRCCLRGGPRLSSAGIGLLAEQFPLPGHRRRRSHFRQATLPAASARDPLPASPVVGRMSRIR